MVEYRKYIDAIPFFIEGYGCTKGLSDCEVVELFQRYNIFDMFVENIEFLSILPEEEVKDIIDLNIQSQDPNFYLEDVSVYNVAV